MILPPFSSITVKNKRGQSNSIFPFIVGAVLAVVLIFVTLTLGVDIMDGVRGTQTTNTVSANVSDNSIDALANISSQGGNIGLVLGAGILLLVLAVMFGKLMKSGMGGPT